MKIFHNLIIFSVLFFVFISPALSQPYENIPAAVHIQSDISDGKYSIEELAKLAKENSVKVIIISDTLLRRWEYGLWPWRHIVKKAFEEKSVIRMGVENYLSLIEQAQKKNPEVLIIPGVEVGSFYYWKGGLFSKDGLTLFHWHKKMLVVGMKNAEDYKKLPVVASYARLPQRPSDVIKFWPVLLIVLGFLASRIRLKRHFSFQGKAFSGYVNPFESLRYILIGVGLISLVNNLTFSVSPYDSYRGEQGIKPYQYLIDYVNKRGGAVFWLHPESSYTREILGVKILTYSYKEDLLRAKDYQGFSGLYADNITITQPGDLWDKILLEYCQGKRQRPVWIIGEVGFDGLSKKDMTAIETVFLLSNLGQEEVLQALREGRMYAQLNRQKNNFSLARFIVTDQQTENVGFMGDEINIKGAPRIEIKLKFTASANEEIALKLIREGKVIQEVTGKGPELIWVFSDQGCPKGSKTFYRLEMESNFCRVLSNPIFVTVQ